MMKWLIAVITVSIFLQLTAAKGSDKTYPKKVRISKPTKGPKSPIDEFSNLPEEDLEFIKELDKQFKMHGDKIKIKVERDNSTVKNSKRTIEGDLGYGNQNGVQQPRFQFSKPKYSIYPYSQRDIPPIPFHKSPTSVKAPFSIQPSNAYEIKETPGGYQTFTPTHQPFHSQFTPKSTAFPAQVFPTPAFYNQFNQFQQQYQTPQSSHVPTYVPTSTPVPHVQQQYDNNEPVIVLRIPGPAKYAAHLQTLLQRYLEIRAAQYIRAFEEHEARVEQQQALYQQKQQQHQQQQQEQQEKQQQEQQQQQQQQQQPHQEIQPQQYYNQPIQSTDYYRPYVVPRITKPQPYSPISQQQYTAAAHQLQRPIYVAPEIQRTKEYSVQIQEPHQQHFSIPKPVQIQQQQQEYLIPEKPQEQEYRVAQVQEQQQTYVQAPEDYVISKPQVQAYVAPKLQHQSQPQYTEEQEEEQEDVEEPEIPEARHRPKYSNAPVPDEVHEDENHQLFSYDNQQQTEAPASQYQSNPAENHANKEPVPHKVYGVPPSLHAVESLPTLENSPRLTHTQVHFNNAAKPNDHSVSYPLPPVASTTPKFDYQKHTYETSDNQESYKDAPQASIVSITQRPYNYHAHSSLEPDFQGDAPYTQSQFKKLNDLIDRLKQRSAKYNPTASTPI